MSIAKTFLGLTYQACKRLGRRAPLERSERVLVVRLDEIGDLVMCSAFFRELRRWLPRAKIALVVKPSTRNLVEKCPYVDEVIDYAPRRTGGKMGLLAGLREIRKTIRTRLGGRPDVAILPRFDLDRNRGIHVVLASGARRTVAYTEHATEAKESFDAGLDRFITDVVRPAGGEHEVQRNLAVITAMGGRPGDERIELWLSHEDEEAAGAWLGRITGAGAYVAICPSCGVYTMRRRWPVERYAEVARHFASSGMGIVVVGGPGDEPLGEAICRDLGGKGLNCAGKLSLRETAAVLKRCALYIGNDTGPMHLAAGAGVPAVVPWCHPRSASSRHASAPERFGPWGVANRVIRPGQPLPPCTDGCDAEQPHCILQITVAEVIEAAEALLKEKASAT